MSDCVKDCEHLKKGGVMEQQDYLKRQIEQIGLVLGGLLNLLRGRKGILR